MNATKQRKKKLPVNSRLTAEAIKDWHDYADHFGMTKENALGQMIQEAFDRKLGRVK